MKSETIRLLLAEDNPLDADQVVHRLAEDAPDFDVTVARTAKECLEMAGAAKYDIILLDNRLPDMLGVELLPHLAGKQPPAPVVLITGFGDAELVVRALQEGAADYVTKRGDYLATLPEQLHAVVERFRKNTPLWHRYTRRKARILFIGADAGAAGRRLERTGPQFKTAAALSWAQALQTLEDDAAFAAIVLEVRLSDISGLDFFRLIRQRGVDIPVVVVTNTSDEEAALAVLKLGAADYILKRDNYFPRLASSLERAILRHQLDLMREQRRAEMELRLKAMEKMLPMCSYCRKVRAMDQDPADRKSWMPLESYFLKKMDTWISHSICPDCEIGIKED